MMTMMNCITTIMRMMGTMRSTIHTNIPEICS